MVILEKYVHFKTFISQTFCCINYFSIQIISASFCKPRYSPLIRIPKNQNPKKYEKREMNFKWKMCFENDNNTNRYGSI
jgi:hypothetical protein